MKTKILITVLCVCSLFQVQAQVFPTSDAIWNKEYNTNTSACSTKVPNVQVEMIYANGYIIQDLIDVHITCDGTADIFELEYGVTGFEKGEGTIIQSTTNKFSIGNQNLQSNTGYDYYVRVKCNDIYGEWSEKKTFSTTDVFHYSGSEAFEVSFDNITNNSVIVEWRKIIGSGYSKSYLIEYGPRGFERGKGKTQSSMLNLVELSGLEPDTAYSFFVRSFNVSITEPVWSVEHIFKTFPCKTDISGIESEEMLTTCLDCNGAVAVSIEWDDMADLYELEYGLTGFEKGTGTLIEVGDESNVIIPYLDLNSYTDYDFYIRAMCNGEFGEWTDANSFSTTKLHVGMENIQNPIFKIFPNPVEDVLYIDFDSVFALDNIVVSIFDLIGSIKYKSGYQESYNISSLPAGTYVVNVTMEKLSETMLIQKK